MLIPIHSRTNKANITGLKPDETYFVRAAVTNHYRKNQRTYTRLITSTLDESVYFSSFCIFSSI